MTLKNEYVHVSQHPIIATKLSELRNAKQRPKVVRELTRDISLLLGYEASMDTKLITNETVSNFNIKRERRP